MGVRLEIGQRGVALGMTGTGKSTLCSYLVKAFLNDYPTSRVIIIDSKPRYRATFLPNGLRAKYKRWAKGETIAGSVAIHDENQVGEALKLSRCLIFQSLYPNRRRVLGYKFKTASVAEALFRESYDKRPTLLYVDEFYDILGGGLAPIADERLLQVIRAGRELSMASLFAAQRPRSIPLPALTEATKYYLFYLEYLDDIQYLRKHGPKVAVPAQGHDFTFFERIPGGKRIEQTMRLKVAA